MRKAVSLRLVHFEKRTICASLSASAPITTASGLPLKGSDEKTSTCVKAKTFEDALSACRASAWDPADGATAATAIPDRMPRRESGPMTPSSTVRASLVQPCTRMRTV